MEVDDANRPYHSKRSHRKSRAGCISCKKRKVKTVLSPPPSALLTHLQVKCDEARPSCRHCALRKEQCVYTKSQKPSSKASPLAPAEFYQHGELALRGFETTTPSFTPSSGTHVGPY